jgi:hypothetical protein
MFTELKKLKKRNEQLISRVEMEQSQAMKKAKKAMERVCERNQESRDDLDEETAADKWLKKIDSKRFVFTARFNMLFFPDPKTGWCMGHFEFDRFPCDTQKCSVVFAKFLKEHVFVGQEIEVTVKSFNNNDVTFEVKFGQDQTPDKIEEYTKFRLPVKEVPLTSEYSALHNGKLVNDKHYEGKGDFYVYFFMLKEYSLCTIN